MSLRWRSPTSMLSIVMAVTAPPDPRTRLRALFGSSAYANSNYYSAILRLYLRKQSCRHLFDNGLGLDGLPPGKLSELGEREQPTASRKASFALYVAVNG